MTQTVQTRSWAITLLNETGKDLTIKHETKRPETEDSMSLLLSICDSMNNLYEVLCRLEYVLKVCVQKEKIKSHLN